MLYIIYKKSDSSRELKNIKKIKYKASKKRSNSSIDSSRNELDYDSSLSRDSNWDEERQPDERKEINRLDHVVTNMIKTKKINIMTSLKMSQSLVIHLIYLAVINDK